MSDESFDGAASNIAESGDGGKYVINMGNLTDCIKQRSVDSIIKNKFGKESARICRVLLEKKMLEQKQIAELAMIPAKDTRERLYKMLAANYVKVQVRPDFLSNFL
jgi:DNA-directed RNA polymerase III subunit RPC3